MRILSCTAKNFGSYKELVIGFTETGLSLVYGRTGAGKSTIPDVVAWTLFGITAKDGAADDVRSWQADDPTTGLVVLDSGLQVVRVRGKGANDLYFLHPDEPVVPVRGKDITETQKLIEQRLGVSAEVFILSSYYHEFSPAGSFFTAKAKDRRSLFENITHLDLPKKLAEKTSEKRKVTKEEYAQKEKHYAKLQGQREQLERSQADCILRHKNWDSDHARRLAHLQSLVKCFEDDRHTKIEALKKQAETFDEYKEKRKKSLFQSLEEVTKKLESPAPEHRCPTCDQVAPNLSQYTTNVLAQQEDIMDQLESFKRWPNDYLEQAKMKELEPNPHKVNLEYALSETNTYSAQLNQLIQESIKLERELLSADATLVDLDDRISDLNELYDLSASLRGELLKNVVKSVEDGTNKMLETYFDAEIRVAFELYSDNLNVVIQKSGYECSYKQLSKGQRGLLKLCFSVSIMEAAANRSGVHFSNLFLDEALDGLDSDLKIRAFGLLQELSVGRDSVLVIDHAPEFQNLFDRKFHVILENDFSVIEEQK